MGASNNYRYVGVSVPKTLNHYRYADTGALYAGGGAWWDNTYTMGASGRVIISVIDNSSNTVQVYKNGSMILNVSASNYVSGQTSVPGYYVDVNAGDTIRLRIYYGIARATIDLFYVS